MGFTNTAFSFSLALTAAFLLHSATAVNPFCNPAGDKPFCTHLTKNAKTWPEAMRNALKAALERAMTDKKIIYAVGNMMPHHAPPEQKKAMANLCRTVYTYFVIGDLMKCIELVNRKKESDINGQDLKYSLSWASFSLCIDGFDEAKIPVPAEIKKLDDEIKKLKSTLLAIVEKKP